MLLLEKFIFAGLKWGWFMMKKQYLHHKIYSWRMLECAFEKYIKPDCWECNILREYLTFLGEKKIDEQCDS